MDRHELEKFVRKEALDRAHRLQGRMMEEIIASPLSLEINQTVIEPEKNLVFIYFRFDEYEGCARGEFMRDGTVLPHWVEIFVASLSPRLPKSFEAALEETRHSLGIGLRLMDKGTGLAIGKTCEAGESTSLQEVIELLRHVTFELRQRCVEEVEDAIAEPLEPVMSVH